VAEAGVFDRALADVLAAYLRKAFLGWFTEPNRPTEENTLLLRDPTAILRSSLITQERGIYA
jgi:hypothetical protein